MFGAKGRNPAVLGVDVGTTAIKVAAMDFQGKTPRLCGFAIETPAGPDQAAGAETANISAAVRKAVDAAAPNARIAATAIPAEAVITRIIRLPTGLGDAALRARISLDIEDSLKQPRNEIAYDFRVLRGAQGDNEQPILLVATRRDEVETRRHLLSASGLRCRLVDVDAHALARTALADTRLRPTDDNRPTALLDIGQRLRLMVFDRRSILYQQDHAIDADATASERLRVIERALAMHHGSPASRDPAALGLAGGGTDPQLAAALNERLGLPAYCVDPRPGVTVEGEPGESGLAARLPRLLTAIGLALHAGDPNAHWR